jgi:hypothetical protein
MITETKLEAIIKEAFQKTWKICMSDEFHKKDHTHANYFRSAKFVYEVAKCLWDDLYLTSGKKLRGKKLHVQKVDDQGNKSPGEWLYDICITKTKKVDEANGQKSSSAHINTEIIWAIESESSTSLSEFCDDFGKLICSGAQNCLYLHGLDQTTETGRNEFIKRRLETIQGSLLANINSGVNFYMGFWPSPKKVGGKSIWDYEKNRLEVLIEWIQIYKL